jgi:uncharacterized SAM-binding protein YcdF (DUF218 family)
VIRDLGRLVVAAVVGVVLVVGYTSFRIWDQGGRDDRQPADAIVVLGAAQYDGRPSPVFRARLEHAVGLYREGLAPYLVVTGGKALGDRTTEADAARQFALERGVPPDAILIEDRSRTTLESLTAVAGLLRERGLTSAVFVSDRTHMLRVLRMARDLGIVASGSPTTTSPIDADTARRLRATAREAVALGVYFLAGRAAPDEPVFGDTGD